MSTAQGPVRVTFTGLLSEVPELAQELAWGADWLASQIRASGGAITDIGYDVREQRAEIVAEHPDSGDRWEWTVRILPPG